MRILLTNDDGIWAPGIQALITCLENLGDVYVVAPDREKSAMGHSITVHHPLRIEDIEIPNSKAKAWAVDGTPADCVKLGVEALLDKTPDIVISGINQGANLGTDVLYSGTVSAAIEGMINGVPSIAVSLSDYRNPKFHTATEFTVKLLEDMREHTLTVDTLLNINVPNLDKCDIKGVSVTKLGQRRYKNLFEERKDPRGKSYFWMGGEVEDNLDEEDSDVAAIHNGYISITPIHFDLTNYRIINQVKNWDLKF